MFTFNCKDGMINFNMVLKCLKPPTQQCLWRNRGLLCPRLLGSLGKIGDGVLDSVCKRSTLLNTFQKLDRKKASTWIVSLPGLWFWMIFFDIRCSSADLLLWLIFWNTYCATGPMLKFMFLPFSWHQIASWVRQMRKMQPQLWPLGFNGRDFNGDCKAFYGS
jgi:hypothetical protein